MVSSLRFDFKEKETPCILPVKAKMKRLSLRTSGRPPTPGTFQATPSTPLREYSRPRGNGRVYQLFPWLIHPSLAGSPLLARQSLEIVEIIGLA